VAGFDTTRDAITATALIMLENTGVRERVLADPSRAIPKLTEEALRRDAPHPFASREALDAGLASPEGNAAAADVANFADGGATMFVARD
jgi:hypothetical protein